MTNRERVMHAFAKEPVDRVPMGFWYHFSPNADWSEDMIKDHIDWYRESGCDFIKVMCDGYFNYPNPGIEKIVCAKDWYNLTPMGEKHPYIRGQIERVKGVVEAVKGECCVFYNVFNPMSLMRFGTSEELLMAHLKEDPEAVCYAFRVIAQDIRSLIDGVIKEAGADGIYYCVQNAEEFRFTAEEYEKYVTAYELPLLEYANTLSSSNILHCCGWAGDKNRIEVWKEYPAAAINWAVYVENMKLEEGREFFNNVCVVGGFDNRKSGVLYSGAKEEVKRETRKIIANVGTIGVIIGADCTIPADLPVEHLHWVKEALEEIGSGEGKRWNIIGQTQKK